MPRRLSSILFSTCEPTNKTSTSSTSHPPTGVRKVVALSLQGFFFLHPTPFPLNLQNYFRFFLVSPSVLPSLPILLGKQPVALPKKTVVNLLWDTQGSTKKSVAFCVQHRVACLDLANSSLAPADNVMRMRRENHYGDLITYTPFFSFIQLTF